MNTITIETADSSNAAVACSRPVYSCKPVWLGRSPASAMAPIGILATHVRIGDARILAPIYFAAILWAGLWLRDRRVGALLSAM